MNKEFKIGYVQKVGLITAKGVNAVKAGIDAMSGKGNAFDHYYKLRMMEEVRHPNRLAMKGWATIVAIVVGSTLVANSLK